MGSFALYPNISEEQPNPNFIPPPSKIEVFNKIKSQLNDKQCWISVKNKLPDKDFGYVLCCGERGGMFVGTVSYRLESNGKAIAWVHGGRGRYITHWMPLPEPPKGE